MKIKNIFKIRTQPKYIISELKDCVNFKEEKDLWSIFHKISFEFSPLFWQKIREDNNVIIAYAINREIQIHISGFIDNKTFLVSIYSKNNSYAQKILNIFVENLKPEQRKGRRSL